MLGSQPDEIYIMIRPPFVITGKAIQWYDQFAKYVKSLSENAEILKGLPHRAQFRSQYTVLGCHATITELADLPASHQFGYGR